jgi:hypothetical protein
LAIALVLLAAACSETTPPQAARDAGCFVQLAFDSEDARRAFLLENAETIADLAGTGEGMFGADREQPKTYLFAPSSCAHFESSHLGLRIPSNVAPATSDRTLTELASSAPQGATPSTPFDQDTNAACILRIFPPPRDGSGPLMSALGNGGLRTWLVTGANDGLFAAYDEPCDLVRQQTAPAVSRLGSAWPAPTFCANVSLRRCGYGGNVSVGQ